MTSNHENEWLAAEAGWRLVCEKYPVLGLRPTVWRLNNFLRSTSVRRALEENDAMRRVCNKHRIVHIERFPTLVFDLLTGKQGAA